MDKQRRKELQAQYKEMPVYMGVVAITNTQNGKVYVVGYPNLKNQWEIIQGWLDTGTYSSGALMRDWKKYGKQAFTYKVLEEKQREGESPEQVQQQLRRMKQKWLEELQPYGEKGYNQPGRA